MCKGLFILDFDDGQGIIDPAWDQPEDHVPERLLYAFVPEEDIEHFVGGIPHRVLGRFDTVAFKPLVYEVDIDGFKLTLCQAPLGAPAATQLLDWLIAHGAHNILAIGTAGVIRDLPENKLLLPVKALRDEGTSFHYAPANQFIRLDSKYLDHIKGALASLGINFQEVTTWTTDGFFRETPQKIVAAKRLGASTVEMECAALAACAKYRHVNFAQLLFSADSLAAVQAHDTRTWGRDSHSLSLRIGCAVLTAMPEMS